jgi:hypothetical protein
MGEDLSLSFFSLKKNYDMSTTRPLCPSNKAFFCSREFIFFQKKLKKFFLSFSSFSFSFSLVHTLWVLLSLMNFTKVRCEGKLEKGVTYKL